MITSPARAGAAINDTEVQKNGAPFIVTGPAQVNVDFLAVLIDLFPRALMRRERKPLKISIRSDIVTRLGEIDGLVGFLRWYCSSMWYFRACIEGTSRVDLDGNAVGQITADEAAHAKDSFDRINGRAWRSALEKRRMARAERNARAWAEYHERKRRPRRASPTSGRAR